MNRLHVPGLVMLLLLTCPIAAQDADTIVEAPEVGFRLTIPDVGWGHREQRGEQGLSTLAVGPAALGGLVQLSVQVTTSAETGPEAGRAQSRALRASIVNDETILDVEDL
ncbi:MAG: hypothetical protein ACYTGC_16215, partial [Planctomycetota bacterium]